MAMREADTERAMTDDFRESEIGCFDVEIAFHYLQVGCDTAEEVVGFFVGQVA